MERAVICVLGRKRQSRRRSRKKTVKRFVARILRTIGFLIVGLLMRWPVILFLFLIRPLRLFDYLFLVYPGSDNDLRGYCPPWLAKTWFFSRKPSVAGIITKGEGGRGLYLVVPNVATDFLRNKRTCEDVLRRLRFIQEVSGARAIAIAGQVPSMVQRHGINLTKPFVRGNKGTVFCVMETVNQIIRKEQLVPGKFEIAIVGVGYVGGILLDSLQEQGHKVNGVDIKITRKGVLIGEDGLKCIGAADLVIVLTPRGKDSAPYAYRLKSGAIVVDDTHPRILEGPRGAKFYKVAVGMANVAFWPSLPGYESTWIPGCAVEGIYSAASGDFNGTPQEEFNEECRQLGFVAHLVA